ncbi:FG-GAP-like repeat-containing protein [Nocardioides sp. TRM66260-LWL]|uniref:FG-GAP-like repeat-containing protein n=1 Tax=Nocardioides sp. TRM66260-LWL TaxID=2874478 RepID=UPI001CC3EFA3|nr:FG-GAP-like repeat-containing protein [Nocardioides sp. TRM66260-LWL]MBZ5734220.1 FG-GAP-like repeat-containing protein [Nocardioides sp. TRM66260-LWL]
MSRTKSGYVTACQQLLALALVLAALVPATNLVSLDIVREHPGIGRADGPGTLASGRLAAYVREARRTSEVPTAPVKARVREIALTAPAGRTLGRVAGAGALARTAARVEPQARVGQRRVARGEATVLTSTPQPVTGYGAVGVTWQHAEEVSDADLSFRVRTRTGRSWSDWQTLPYHDDHGPDPDSAEGRKARPGTDPLLVGDVDDVQVQATAQPGTPVPDDVRLAVIDPGADARPAAERPALDTATMDGDDGSDSVEAATAPSDGGSARAALSAAAYTPKPVIYSRAQWGADESKRDKGALQYYEVHAGFVHHTVNANDYTRDEVPAIIRGIYAYHTQSKGWSDIGYNFLVDRFGRIWEGRYGGIDRPVVGAHTLNYNDYSFAMSAIGNYEVQKPTTAMVQAYGALFAWKLSLHGVDASSTRQKVGSSYFQAINGHRDAGQTACPGKYLYARIPEIRRLAAEEQRGFAGRQLESNLAGGPYPDLIVRRAKDQRLMVLPTGGLMSFAGKRSDSRGWSDATRVQVTPDLTGDGAADLVTMTTGGAVELHQGTGQGDFARTAQTLSSTFRGHDLVTAVGDLDGDGRPDLVARRTSDGMLDLWRGRAPKRASDGSRRAVLAAPVHLGVTVPGARQLAAAGDLDGNGRADLLVVDGAGALTWRRSSATARELGVAQPIATAGAVDAVVGGGDYTGDGRPDLVVRRSGRSVQLMPGLGNGRFGSFRGPFANVAGGSGLVGGVDIAGSDGLDLLYRDGDSLVRYTQSGTFDTGRPIDTGVSGAGADRLIHAGDWDRDGFGDVIYRNGSTGSLFLRRGDGTGRLGQPILLGRDFGKVGLLAGVGDVTGDGWPDLMGQPSGGSMRIYPGRGVDGLRASYVAHRSIKAAQQIPVGRWDADGAPDSLFRLGSTTTLYRGNGPGGLMSGSKVGLDLSPYDWVVGVRSATLGSGTDLIVRDRRKGTLLLLPRVAQGTPTPRTIGDGMGAYDLAG